MIFTARSNGGFDLNGRGVRCALGGDGVVAAADKREGDGKTPLGVWPIRRVLYRPDRDPPPRTALVIRAIATDDGWCDAPDDPAYNRLVKLPYPASCEALWRKDGLYDLIVVLGYNDEPPVPPRGSAIFLHVANQGYPPTEGCVALSRSNLETLLALAAPGDAIAVERADV